MLLSMLIKVIHAASALIWVHSGELFTANNAATFDHRLPVQVNAATRYAQG